ncbi:MAG: hypothetical protein K2M76_05570 [Muribaculaceae bacterium]|nr:hypothetical protein [Muribaculaceae bacterium]
MRMLFRYILRVVLPMIALSLNVSCSTDEQEPLEYRADIVTFVGNETGGASFGRIEQNSETVTKLMARGVRVDTTRVTAGSRVLMVYEEASELSEPLSVNILSLQLIVTGEVRVADDMAGWNSDAVYMLSMWRTGGYLNLECRVENSEEKRNFCVVADPATVSNAVPDLYVVHDMGEHTASYMRRIYASWDISEVWNRRSCRGVRVHINDSNRGINEMTFTKD